MKSTRKEDAKYIAEIADKTLKEGLEAYQNQHEILEKEKDIESDMEGVLLKTHKYQLNFKNYCIVFDATTAFVKEEWVVVFEDCTLVGESGEETRLDLGSILIDVRDYFNYWE